MDPIRELAAQLGEAQTFDAIGLAVTEAARRAIGVSGLNVMPLFPGALPFEEATFFSAEHPPTFMRERCAEAFPSTTHEIAELSAVAQRSDRMIDANQILGWNRLERTPAYNEHWKTMGVERQIIATNGHGRRTAGVRVHLPEAARKSL